MRSHTTTEVDVQVVAVAAQGNTAGAVINADLVDEDTALARKGA